MEEEVKLTVEQKIEIIGVIISNTPTDRYGPDFLEKMYEKAISLITDTQK